MKHAMTPVLLSLALLWGGRAAAQTPAELAAARQLYEDHAADIRELQDIGAWRELIELYHRLIPQLTRRGREEVRYNIALCYIELGECNVARRILWSLTRSRYPSVARNAQQALGPPCPTPAD